MKIFDAFTPINIIAYGIMFLVEKLAVVGRQVLEGRRQEGIWLCKLSSWLRRFGKNEALSSFFSGTVTELKSQAVFESADFLIKLSPLALSWVSSMVPHYQVRKTLERCLLKFGSIV